MALPRSKSTIDGGLLCRVEYKMGMLNKSCQLGLSQPCTSPTQRVASQPHITDGQAHNNTTP